MKIKAILLRKLSEQQKQIISSASEDQKIKILEVQKEMLVKLVTETNAA